MGDCGWWLVPGDGGGRASLGKFGAMMQRIREAVVRVARTDSKQIISLPLLEKSLLPILSLASVVYCAASFVRRVLYRLGFFTQTRLPVPVVSVGNITWGGNGKTPMVEFLCRYFLHASICPLVLTRGYAGGEEARLLQSHLDGSSAKIGVGPKRTAIARSILKQYGVMTTMERVQIAQFIGTSSKEELPMRHAKQDAKVGVVLLDDGMQHWQLARDLEIVMVNLVSIWGNQLIVPRGPLRESLQELRRADVVVLHHADLVSQETIESVKTVLRTVMRARSIVVFSRMAPHYLFRLPASGVSSRHISDRCQPLVSLDAIKGSVVLSVSGVGCPESVSLALEQMDSFYVERMDYVDHHKFQAKDLNVILLKYLELQQRFPNKNVLLVLTEKDYTRDPTIWMQMNDVELLVLHSSLEVLPIAGGLEALQKMLSTTVGGCVLEGSQLGSGFWKQTTKACWSYI